MHVISKKKFFASKQFQSAFCHQDTKLGVKKDIYFEHRKFSPMSYIPWQDLIDRTELNRPNERKTVHAERNGSPNGILFDYCLIVCSFSLFICLVLFFIKIAAIKSSQISFLISERNMLTSAFEYFLRIF